MDIDRDEIQYAARQTKIVHKPVKQIETFGETVVYYYVLSELMDEVGRIRIREGRIEVRRPRLITPGYLARRLTENFGEKAEKYAELLVDSGEATRFLEYGLTFYKQQHKESVVSGDINTISEEIVRQREKNEGVSCGVVIGVDDMWEVSLLRFVSRLIQLSLPRNIHEMADRRLLDASGSDGVPAGVRVEIENGFQAARGDRRRIRQLGKKIQDFGLFEEYEDRLYALLRELD